MISHTIIQTIFSGQLEYFNRDTTVKTAVQTG
jgi:hypothetical protein